MNKYNNKLQVPHKCHDKRKKQTTNGEMYGKKGLAHHEIHCHILVILSRRWKS